MVNLSETLIIVTADHSHNMVFSGYATRGSNPTGLGEQNLDDDLPYTLMTYSNGPGFNNNFEVNTMGTNVTRMNLSSTNFINDREYRYSANGLRDSSTHGGDDVNIFAIGPMAHLFSRTHDQTHVANVMAYSACIGPYRDDSTARCAPSSVTSEEKSSDDNEIDIEINLNINVNGEGEKKTALVSDNDASNRIPSSCDLIRKKEKTCSIFFQEFEKLINHDLIKFENSMNTPLDTKYMNGYKQYMKSNLCGKHWNEMITYFLLDDWKIITCKEDTPGIVKQSCPDICNRPKSGNVAARHRIDYVKEVGKVGLERGNWLGK